MYYQVMSGTPKEINDNEIKLIALAKKYRRKGYRIRKHETLAHFTNRVTKRERMFVLGNDD